MSRKLTFAFLFLITASMIAAAATTTDVTVSRDTVVNGTTLTPGDYKVTIDGAGPDVKVTFKNRGKVVATAPATLKAEEKSEPTSIVSAKTDSGYTLKQIRIKKQSVNFSQNANASMQGAQAQ